MNLNRHHAASPRRPLGALALAAAVALCAALASGGCAVGALVGGMAENHKRNSTHAVAAEYEGLVGKSFAVVVAADRVIQSDYPDAVARLTIGVTERLTEYAGASGVVPADKLLTYLYEHPRWAAMRPSALAKELGVERLVYIDLHEFRLHDPGNKYLWNGAAAGTVSVVEADSSVPDQFAFQRAIRVGFPDGTAYGPDDYPRTVVEAALASRFIDRASWLFYEHQEPYYPKY